MQNKFQTYLDENLKDIPINPEDVRAFIANYNISILKHLNVEEYVNLLNDLGTAHRILGDLRSAESCFIHSLFLIENNQLNVNLKILHKIKLAHVYQWMKLFNKSNELFNEIIELCHSNSNQKEYLAFALQHAGKNLYDQQKYKKALNCFKEALKIRLDLGISNEQIKASEHAINQCLKKENELSLKERVNR